MSNRFRHSSRIRCRYLSYVSPKTGNKFRLPMLHVRLVNNNLSFTTVALIDSGATTTFIPNEMAQALQLDLTAKPEDAVGAGGSFSNFKTELQKLFLVKGRQSVFDEFNNIRYGFLSKKELFHMWFLVGIISSKDTI